MFFNRLSGKCQLINTPKNISMVIAMILAILLTNGCYKMNNQQSLAKPAKQNVLIHSGFGDFSKGWFEDGGSNLYVNANGVIETINRLDINNDGFIDLILGNSHDYIERGPTTMFTVTGAGREDWKSRQFSADSGWMSRIIDLDKDGFVDVIVANGENGVTSSLPSYIYWGSTEGFDKERTDLPTLGAYGVAIFDINRDGRLDLIFPSAWDDHHNPGKPLPARVYLAKDNRKFEDATKKYNIEGIAAVAIAEVDLNKDGFCDIVLANYRKEYEYDIDSFVYWGTKDGVDTEAPTLLPTYAALEVITADLNGDQWDDIIFTGGNQVLIYWNNSGQFSADNKQIIEAEGYQSMFSQGRIGCDVADVDGDNQNDLVIMYWFSVNRTNPLHS